MNRRYEKWATAVFLVGLAAYILACVMSPISWSPDGRWIALTRFVTELNEEGSDEQDLKSSELWIISPSSGQRRRLLATSGTILSGPCWSTDGKGLFAVEIEAADTTKPVKLKYVDLNGAARNLFEIMPEDEIGGAIFSAPAPSPDGRRVAFARDKSTVVVARIDGKLERIIEANDTEAFLWSPDGRWLGIFGSGGAGRPSVRFFDTKSSRVVTLDVRYRSVAWLPGGKRLVALKEQSDGTSEGQTTNYISVLEGFPAPREVAGHTVGFPIASWLLPSKKGDAVFFGRASEDDELIGAICRLDLRTGVLSVVYESVGLSIPWALSPDGAKLAFREAGPDGGNQAESILVVLEPVAGPEPRYLAVNDEQWAAVLGNFVEKLKEVDTAELGPRETRQAVFALARAEQFLAAFRSDFPKNPLLAEPTESLKEVRDRFQRAGFPMTPEEAGPKW